MSQGRTPTAVRPPATLHPDPAHAADQIAPPARADLGDEVYYRHPAYQVTHGKVIAHGQHGATCRHEDGETHQVRWEDLLGHRKRRERAFSLVDQGEDGAILADERGQRHFLAGEIPWPATDSETDPAADPDADFAATATPRDPEQPLAKALLVDLAPLSCGCTDHALEDLHKALSEDQPDIWAPHDSLWIRDLIERLTADGLAPLEELRVSLWAWLEGQFHITHPVPPPDLLAPWSPALAASVKAYLQGKPQGDWSAQDWSLWVDYLIRTHLPVERLQAAVSAAQRQGTVLGAIRATLAENLAPVQALAIVEAIRAAGTLARAEDLAHLNRTQAAYAEAKAADLIVDLADRARHGIKRLVLDHLEQHHLSGVSAPADWQPLEQALRDQFGDLNRDWRRIALTEVGEAHNQGFIATLPAGTYVRRLEVYAGACAFCQKIDGAILQVVDPAQEDKDWDRQVWAGKSNVGRSGSPRKRVGNVLVERTDSELWKIPAGLVHPHCRGRFVTIDGIARRDDLTRWLFEEIIPQEPATGRAGPEPEPDPKQDFAAWAAWKLRQSRPTTEN